MKGAPHHVGVDGFCNDCGVNTGIPGTVEGVEVVGPGECPGEPVRSRDPHAPAAVQPGIPPMPVQRPAYAVRLAADGASPPTMGPTDVFGIRIVPANDPGLVTRTSDGQTFHLVMVESPLRVGLDPGIGGEPEPSNMFVMRAEQDVRFVLRCDGCGGHVGPTTIAEHRCG